MAIPIIAPSKLIAARNLLASIFTGLEVREKGKSLEPVLY
jgi:hypothetical protein